MLLSLLGVWFACGCASVLRRALSARERRGQQRALALRSLQEALSRLDATCPFTLRALLLPLQSSLRVMSAAEAAELLTVASCVSPSRETREVVDGKAALGRGLLGSP